MLGTQISGANIQCSLCLKCMEAVSHLCQQWYIKKESKYESVGKIAPWQKIVKGYREKLVTADLKATP